MKEDRMSNDRTEQKQQRGKCSVIHRNKYVGTG